MKLRVDLQARAAYDDVVIVIDTLRSCTVAPILFDNGLERLTLCPSIRLSRAYAAENGFLLLGERNGLPPEGFNYGNSPSEFREVVMHGKGAVMVSENAPALLGELTGARHVLLGSLYNAEGVVKKALELAQTSITLVCSGFRGTEDLDDTLSAGFLAARIKQERPDVVLEGATPLAMTLLRAFPSPLEGLWHSRAGHYLRGLKLEDDIAVASIIAASERVPMLLETIRREGGNLYRFEAEA